MAKIKVPSPGEYYHGVFPGDAPNSQATPLANLQAYQQVVGKNAAYVTCFHDWGSGTAFPWDNVQWILDQQPTPAPYLRLMTRTVPVKFVAETTYTLEAIVNGQFDPVLKAWGVEAKKSTVPLLCEWGTEVNGYWFPWNAAHNGADHGDGFGAPLFKQAYQRIIKTINAQADNISWVFHVNFEDNPKVSWNELEQYYPGSDLIDWIGVSLYGSQSPDDKPGDWLEFVSTMNTIYDRVSQLEGQKPIMLSEFGFCANNGNPGEPAVWTQAALTSMLSNRWPRLAAFSWWNESWLQGNGETVELHVENMRPVADVFKAQLTSQAVLSQPMF
jgi:hypothetical protein